MKPLARKFYSFIWRSIVAFLKIIVKIRFVQRFLILIKILQFKYIKNHQNISLNNYYVIFIRITDDNVAKLNATLKSLNHIEFKKLSLFLIDEKKGFDKNIYLGNITYTDCVLVHKSLHSAVHNLGKIIAENDENIFFVWVNPGDLFSFKTFEKIEYIEKKTENSEVFYFDWLLKSSDNDKYSVLFFPDFSYDLLYSINYLSNAFLHLNKKNWIVYAEFFMSFGEEYIYGVIQSLQKNIIHLPEILCIRQEESLCIPSEPALKALNTRVQIVEKVGKSNHIFLDYDPTKTSIIILSREDSQLLDRCIRSILENSMNEDFEIILVFDKNGKEFPNTNYPKLKNERIKYIFPDQEFNYSAFNNIGAQAAIGQNLVFLNDDIEVMNGNWLKEISQWLDHPEIGIVGGRLYYPDLSIQHAGIVVGLIGHGGNIFRGEREYNKISPFGSIKWYRNYLAVTGACLAIKKELFEKVGQFDEKYELIYSDVALCLELNKAGYRILYNPFVEMIHYEGKTRKGEVVLGDCLLFENQYQIILSKGDLFFNSNLSYLSFIPKLHFFSEMSPLNRLNKLRS